MAFDFFYFIALAFTGGPAVAIPYALSDMPVGAIFLTLLLCYTLPLPLLFYVFGFFEGRDDYKIRLLNKIVSLTKGEIRRFTRSADRVVEKLVQKWGGMGYYVSFIFLSFAVGFLWAALIAHLLRVPRQRAYTAIAFGALLGLLFWFLVVLWSIEFVNVYFFVILVLCLAGVSFIYGHLHEIKTLREILRKMRT